MVEVISHLLVLYIALGLMLVGFGYMFSGKTGGARAAQFYFAGSLRWTLGHLRSIVTTVLMALWDAFVVWIGRPLLHRLARALHWLVTRPRGWLRG